MVDSIDDDRLAGVFEDNNLPSNIWATWTGSDGKPFEMKVTQSGLECLQGELELGIIKSLEVVHNTEESVSSSIYPSNEKAIWSSKQERIVIVPTTASYWGD